MLIVQINIIFTSTFFQNHKNNFSLECVCKKENNHFIKHIIKDLNEELKALKASAYIGIYF